MRTLCLAVFIWAGVMGVTAGAATLFETQSVTVSGPAPQLLQFREFDPDDGVLEIVTLEFIGAFTFNYSTLPNLQPGPVGSTIPVSYTAPVFISMGIDPLSGRGFETLVASNYVQSVNGSGLEEAQVSVLPTSFRATVENNARPEFGIDDFDLPVQAENTVNAARGLVFFNSVSDFLPENEQVKGIPIFSLLNFSVSSPDNRVVLLPPSMNGVMRLTYHYTPPPPPVDPGVDVVPLPASLGLLLSGLGVLGVGLRNKRRSASTGVKNKP